MSSGAHSQAPVSQAPVSLPAPPGAPGGGSGGHLPPVPPVPDRSSIQTSSILLIVAGVVCGTLVPTVFGIIALTQLDRDPESARRLNRVGWICCAVLLGLYLLLVLAMFALPFVMWILVMLASGGS